MLLFSIVICGIMASFPIIYLISSFLSSIGQKPVRLKSNSTGSSPAKPRKKSRSKPELSGGGKFASPSSSTTKTHRKSIPKRNSEPYWKERGWVKKGKHLEGYYRTKYGSYEGEIILIDPPKFYIYDLPVGIKDHDHQNCFQYRDKQNGKNKFYVHFKIKPTLEEFSEGIRGVEKILREVLGNAKG